VLSGKEGPATNAVLVNAAAALVAGGAADSLRDGMDVARISIGSGAAAKKLEQLARLSSEPEAAPG
jgi:anthranilate phosphoribosyltransferase